MVSADKGKWHVFTGVLEVTKSGKGFVVVNGHDTDISIMREGLALALHGDTVEVIVPAKDLGKNKMRGVIKTVISRPEMRCKGKIQLHGSFAFLLPDDERYYADIYIPLQNLNGAKDKETAIVRLLDWDSKQKNPMGEVISVISNESANESAMQSILVQAGFSLHFPDAVMQELEQLEGTLSTVDATQRRDFRSTLTLTIDPIDAKDFDDALSFRLLEDGLWEIGVHIADVTHFIKEGTALDAEAFNRATSVYLPDRVLPMLPEKLSNEWCSLRPHEDKLTFSAVFHIDIKGKVHHYWLGKTMIHSQKRYYYEQVQDVIDGGDDVHKNELLTMHQIAQNLRKDRFSKGAINFSSQEVRFVLDKDAKPTGIMIKESKPAHQLIEEFMLLANRTVAEHVGKIKLGEDGVPLPYRIHDAPDMEKLKTFSRFAARYGIKLDLSKQDKIAPSFNAMLNSTIGKPEQPLLEQLGIRTMSKAVYSTHNIGHYGLAFDHYCHFTSPIRRYPDVLVHRVLQQCLQHNIVPIKDLEVKCRHCSAKEKSAMDAERTATKYKQVEYMVAFIGEVLEAVITGVSNSGFWAETIDQRCEGMVAMRELSQIDSFELKEQEYALVGRHSGKKFTMGDRVMVIVVAANLETRRIDFTLPYSAKPKPSKKKPKRRK